VKERELTPDLKRVADLLDRVGHEQRETLSAAESLEEAPGLERVEILREEPLPRARGFPGGTRFWLTTIVTVAAGLLILLRVLPSDEEVEGPTTEFLAGEGFTLVPPAGTGEPPRLEWTFGATQGIVFEVRVLDPSDERVLLRERVRETRLSLDAARTLTWPSTVLVEIDALDEGGRLVDSLQELSSSH
jgi:hypothetical protein